MDKGILIGMYIFIVKYMYEENYCIVYKKK